MMPYICQKLTGIDGYYFYAGLCKGFPDRYSRGGIAELCRHILMAKACEMMEDRFPGAKNINVFNVGYIQWNNEDPFILLSLSIDRTVNVPLTDMDNAGGIHLHIDNIDRFLSNERVKEMIEKYAIR